jgi:hypothetical protein
MRPPPSSGIQRPRCPFKPILAIFQTARLKSQYDNAPAPPLPAYPIFISTERFQPSPKTYGELRAIPSRITVKEHWQNALIVLVLLVRK